MLWANISDWSPKTPSKEKCKDTAHAKSIHIPQIKSLFFLFLSLVRSAAKTNWCCDECNKYDRWDIWVLLTSHHAPEWREQVLLRFTAHLPTSSWYSPLSHTQTVSPSETQSHCWVSTAPLQLTPTLRETGLLLSLAVLHVQHDYAWIISPLIKPAMILQIINQSVRLTVITVISTGRSTWGCRRGRRTPYVLARKDS